MFSVVPVAAAGLAVWALRTPAVPPGGTARLRDLLTAVRQRPILGGMWLTTLPGLIFGTLGVLAPLRLDELGAGSTAIAAVFLFAAALEAVVSPIVGRHLRPHRPPAAGDRRARRRRPWCSRSCRGRSAPGCWACS